jgi:3-isopropylmalate/(R)-2-methylmalate dehydratase small subunit
MTPDHDPRIVRIAGPALVLRGDDIDTDRIMPARFLRAVTFDGLETHLFEDDRAAVARQGRVHPLDAPAGRSASVLLVNRNFGCGSSREHAPQGIARWGIRAIVGESFAEIFFSNATALGMPCVSARPDDVTAIMTAVEHTRGTLVEVDLSALCVTVGADSWPVHMPASAREAFLAGTWDATALLTAEFDQVLAVAARLPYVRGF